jgi:hypothetical protein
MPDTSKVASLKSDTPGTVLLVVLYLGLGLAATALLCSIVQLVAPDVYSSIEIFAAINTLIELPMLAIAAILFLVWMYQVHVDLKLLFKTYPVGKWEALAGLAIPIYNLYGTWNVFSTLADKLKLQGGKLAEEGAALRFWLPVLYVVTIGSRFLDRMATMPERLNVQADFSTLMLINVGLSVFLWVIWLSMVQAIRQAVRYKFTEVQANMAQNTTGV